MDYDSDGEEIVVEKELRLTYKKAPPTPTTSQSSKKASLPTNILSKIKPPHDIQSCSYPNTSALYTGNPFTKNGKDYNADILNETGKLLESPIVKKEKLDDGSSKSTKVDKATENPWISSNTIKSDTYDMASSKSGEKISYQEDGAGTKMMTILVPKHQHLKLNEFHYDKIEHLLSAIRLGVYQIADNKCSILFPKKPTKFYYYRKFDQTTAEIQTKLHILWIRFLLITLEKKQDVPTVYTELILKT
ncbi:hypothetical protein ACTFIW_000804 [Dictyostelium discoideum]